MDLVNTGEAVADEKDALLEKFFVFAQKIIESLPTTAYSDYIDPCSGLAMIHKESTAVYSEASFTLCEPPQQHVSQHIWVLWSVSPLPLPPSSLS